MLSPELGRGLLAGGPGPRKAGSKDTRQVSGKLKPRHSSDALLRAWPPYKALGEKQMLQSGLVRVKPQKTRAKNSRRAKAGPFHKGQP